MNYWETERPIAADTGRNVLEYYPQAGQLSISKPSWVDKSTGETKRGKTVTLDLAAVKKTPKAMELLRTVLLALRG